VLHVSVRAAQVLFSVFCPLVCSHLPIYLIFEKVSCGSLDILTRLWAEQPRDGLIAVRAKKCFIAIAISALGSFRLPVYWVTSTLSSSVKGRGPKVCSWISSGVEVKNTWSYKSTSPTCILGVLLNYAQGQLYLLFPVVVSVCGGGGVRRALCRCLTANTTSCHNPGTVTWILTFSNPQILKIWWPTVPGILRFSVHIFQNLNMNIVRVILFACPNSKTFIPPCNSATVHTTMMRELAIVVML
jgi:hypothetical protein